MASDKQIAANRRNSMRSTGPRTRSGKARSRANSLRHGLLSKVLVDPALVAETDQLARRIAREHGKPDNCFESRTIAEAELIILSARAVRAQLLDTTSSELAPDTKADDGRHSEEGSRGGKVASAEERDLALAYLRLLPTLSRTINTNELLSGEGNERSEHGKPDDCFESRTIAEAELIILSARAVRAQLLDTTSSELAPDTKADDGRHSEEGSRGGKVASAEERDLALAYLRLLPTLSRTINTNELLSGEGNERSENFARQCSGIGKLLTRIGIYRNQLFLSRAELSKRSQFLQMGARSVVRPCRVPIIREQVGDKCGRRGKATSGAQTEYKAKER